jgi:predicted peptidase
MILLLLALLPQTAVERYLEEKDKSARAKILADIKTPLAELEAELRAPPKRASVEARGQIVKKKLKADHPLGVEFEYVLWVPKDYQPEKTWRLIVSLHGQSGTGDQFINHWLADVQREGSTFLLCPSAKRGATGSFSTAPRWAATAPSSSPACFPTSSPEPRREPAGRCSATSPRVPERTIAP